MGNLLSKQEATALFIRPWLYSWCPEHNTVFFKYAFTPVCTFTRFYTVKIQWYQTTFITLWQLTCIIIWFMYVFWSLSVQCSHPELKLCFVCISLQGTVTDRWGQWGSGLWLAVAVGTIGELPFWLILTLPSGHRHGNPERDSMMTHTLSELRNLSCCLPIGN